MREILNHCMILHVDKEMTEKLKMSDIRNQFVSYQMTGKIALENSMSIKTFSNHVLNAKTKWQLIISTKAFKFVKFFFFATLEKVFKFFLLRWPQEIPMFAKF